jgi:hypothetical protein
VNQDAEHKCQLRRDLRVLMSHKKFAARIELSLMVFTYARALRCKYQKKQDLRE